MARQSNSDAPAGWYPDPSGANSQRYWDGHQWTEHLAPAIPDAGWYPNPENPGQQRYWDGTRWSSEVMPTGPGLFAPTPGPGMAGWGARPPEAPRGRRFPRAVLIALVALLVVAGGGIGAYLLLLRGDESCVSSATGNPMDCSASGAVSQEEFDAQQAKDAEAKRVAKQAADKCNGQVGGLLKGLQELDSRLAVGLPYAEYSSQVGDVRVAYDRIPLRQLDPECLSQVGLPAEDAMNSYIKADTTWNDCIVQLSCDTDSIDPELQQRWNTASSKIRDAQSGLRDIAQPEPASSSST